jgi:hypothetical protein
VQLNDVREKIGERASALSHERPHAVNEEEEF